MNEKRLNEKRLNELLARNNIEKKSDLLIKMGKRINKDDSIDVYEWQKQNKSNFSHMLNGGRPFKQEWIIALEDILHTSLAYLFGGEEVSSMEFSKMGIRYAAFEGTRKAYEELNMETTADGDLIIFNTDEYEKYLLDYIIEYQSIEGIRFLSEKYDFALSNMNNMFWYGDDVGKLSPSNNKEMPYLVAKLICKNNDGELFKKVFRGFELLKYVADSNVLLKDKFLDALMESLEVVRSLQEDYPIKIEEVNWGLVGGEEQEGLFTNPILQALLNRAISVKNDNVIKSIIDYAKQFNQKQIDYLTKNKILKDKIVKVDEIGNIVVNHVKKGNVIGYDGPINPHLDVQIKLGLKVLQQQVEEIKSMPQEKERDVFKSKVVDGCVLKKSSKNEIEYEMMKYMQERNFSMIPRYINTEEGVDRFSFIEGSVRNSYVVDVRDLLQVVEFLRKFHDFAQDKLGKGQVYVHGDLTVKRFVYKEDKLVGVIDWESCSIGKIEDDLVDLILKGTNVCTYFRKNEEVFKVIKDILVTYGLDSCLKIDFATKMRNRIKTRIEKLSSSNVDYEYKYESLHYAMSFVDLYEDRLNSIGGEEK